MDDLTRIIATIAENDVSLTFSLIIALVFAMSLAGRYISTAGALGSVNRAGAGLMTTLGVLGTFTGIFLGLLDFNVSQIDASVPKLLEGLKIAFATSIVGMGAAIGFRLLSAVLPTPTDTSTEATPEDILGSLRSINDSVDRSNESQKAALDEVRRAISSDGDSSLLTQIKLLRTSFQDGQKELIHEFRDFAKTMAEQNSKALIEALENVIRDFNTKLNEQFGENFKQLNEAVGALLTWQENYKEHVETLEARIEAAVDGLESTRKAIEDISARTQTIPDTLDPLKDLLIGLQASVQNLEAHLQAVADLREKAINAFPVIENNIEKLTDDLKTTVTDATDTMRSSVESQSKSFDELRKGYDALRDSSRTAQDSFQTAFDQAIADHKKAQDKLREGYDELRKSASETRDAFQSALDDALSGMQTNLDKAIDGHAKTIDASTEALAAHVRTSWEDSQKRLNQQFETFDQQMQQELTRALEAMGQRLASLSEKFVNDYTPLTNRLRDVIQIAERSQ